MNSKLKTIAALILAVLCVFVSACDFTEKPSPTPAPGTTIEPVGAPIEGGAFSIVMKMNPSTLCPLEPGTREMYDLYCLMFDTLIKYDDNVRPMPAIAEIWSVSEDGLTWTFKIRNGIQFHNGKSLTAADIVHTLDLLKEYYLDKNKTSVYEGVFDYVSSYEAADNHTLVIYAKAKDARLLHTMNFPVLPSDYRNDGTLPSGTGAYKLAKYERGKQMELVANENWWRKTPYIKKITAKEMPDPETALSSLEVKLVDLVHTTALTASRYKQEGKTEIKELMTQEYECLIPNMKNPILMQKKMRQAIIACIDRRSIITECYLGHAVSVDSFIPPDMYTYDQTNIHLEYNIGTAKELLGDLGYSDSNNDGFSDKNGQKLTFKIIVSENPTMRAREHAAERIAQDLVSVGINAEVLILGWQDYQKALGKGDFDLALAGFSMPKDGDISFIVHSKKAKYNYGNYSSSELDQLLDDYIAAIEEAEIKLASSRLQRYFTEELPLISLYFRTNTLVYSSAILGIESARDMDIYKSIDKWYMYREGDEDKVGVE